MAAWTLEASAIGRIAVPPELPEGVAVFVTTRDLGGRITGDTAARLMDTVRARFGIDARLRTCNQVHGADAVRAPLSDEPWRECADCDALWSDQTSVALGIKVADCLPVTMVDPRHAVIANIHSGWRGTVRGITAATLESLCRDTAFEPQAAWAFLGPSIRACCFEVGEDVAAQFDPRWVRRGAAKPHVDVPALTAGLLRERGFAPERVFDSGLCTRCGESPFHSYRRDPGSGHNLQIVAQ